MMWSRFILILMLALVSARPAPELSLEEIEKELEELTAKENDASDTTEKKTDQADTPKQTKSDVPKIPEEDKKVHDEKLEKSAPETKEKKDEALKADEETEKKKSDYREVPPKKPVKPGPPEIPHRDATDADTPPKKPVKPGPPEIPHRDATESDFKDTAAYRRLVEAKNSLSKLGNDYDEYDHPIPPRPRPPFPEAPHKRTYGNDYDEYDHPYPPPRRPRPPFPEAPHRRTYGNDYEENDHPNPPFQPRPRPPFPEAPHRRTYDGIYRKSYDNPPRDTSVDRSGFASNSDPVELMRGMPYEMTRAERMALASGTWLPGSQPVKVPARLPPPVHPDVDARSYHSFHDKMDYKEAEDLILGKNGLTETEKRKRYLMDLLAEKLKAKVSKAQKRGIEIPAKIQDFLWNYESHRVMDTRSDKDRLSH